MNGNKSFAVFLRKTVVRRMEVFSSRYRAYHFLAAYIGVFVMLSVLGYYVASKSSFVDSRPAPMTHKFATDLAYYDMPRLTVALGSGDQATRVRLDISLEVAKNDVGIVEGYQPRITAQAESFPDYARPRPHSGGRIDALVARRDATAG